MIRTRNATFEFCYPSCWQARRLVLGQGDRRGVGAVGAPIGSTPGDERGPATSRHDDRNPRLGWALVSGRRGLMQTAYRVLVASESSSPAMAKRTSGIPDRSHHPTRGWCNAGPALKFSHALLLDGAVWTTNSLR